jgi:hypothetical protein
LQNQIHSLRCELAIINIRAQKNNICTIEKEFGEVRVKLMLPSKVSKEIGSITADNGSKNT